MNIEITPNTTKTEHHAIVRAVFALSIEEQNSLPWQFHIVSDTMVSCTDGVLFDNLPIVHDICVGKNLRLMCINSETCLDTIAQRMHTKGLI